VGSRMELTWCYEIKAWKEVMNKHEIFSSSKPGVMECYPVTYVLRSMIWSCGQIFNILPTLFLVSDLHVSMQFIKLSMKATWVLLPLKYDSRKGRILWNTHNCSSRTYLLDTKPNDWGGFRMGTTCF
jgi:hypothetical protein